MLKSQVKYSFSINFFQFKTFLVFLTLSFYNLSFAQQNENIYQAKSDYDDISNYVSIFKDTSKKISFNQIIQNESKFHFKNNNHFYVHEDTKQSNIWLKINILNKQNKNEDYLLGLLNPKTNKIKIYIQNSYSIDSSEFTGSSFSFDTREINDVDFIFPVTLKINELTKIYVLIENDDEIVNLPVFLYSSIGYSEFSNNNLFKFGLFYGLFFALIFLTILFIIIHLFDNQAIYYLLYLIFGVLYQLNYDGIDFQWILQFYPKASHSLTLFYFSFILIIITKLSEVFFNAKTHFKKYLFQVHLLYLVQFLSSVVILIYNKIDTFSISYLLILTIVTFTVIFITASISYKKQQQLILIFIVSQLINFISLIIIYFDFQFAAFPLIISEIIIKVCFFVQALLLFVAFVLKTSKEKIAVEKVLQLTDKNLKTLFASIEDMIIVVDIKGLIISINEATIKKLGYTFQELAGEQVTKLHPEEYHEEVKMKITGIILGTIESFNLPMQTKDKQIIPVVIKVSRSIWNDNKVVICICSDITEQINAQKELKEYEERFSKAFNLSPMLMSISTIEDGKYIEVNEKFLSTLELTKEEVIGKTSVELGLIENANKRNHLINNTLNNNNLNELTISLKNGKKITGIFLGEKISFNNQDYLLTVFNDITTLKEAENKLIEQKYFLQTLIDNIPNPVYFKNLTGNYIGCNLAFEQFISKNRDEIIGKNAFDIAPQEYATVYIESDKKLIEKGDIQELETKALAGDNSIRDIIFYKSLYYDNEKNPSGIIGTIFDITQRKNIEYQLKEREERLNSILSNASIAIILLDLNFKIIEVNKTTSSLLGFSIDELKNLAFTDVLDDNHQKLFLENFQNIIDKKVEDARFEIILHGKQNKNIWTDITLNSIIYDKNVALVLATFIDITEKKKAKEELELRFDFIQQISYISSYFINIESNEIDNGIDFALQVVGRITNAERCNVFLLNYSDRTFSNTNEWTKNHHDSLIKKLQHLDFDKHNWLINKVENFESISSADIEQASDINKNVIKFCKTCNVKSFILVPIIYRTTAIGFMVISSSTTKNNWDEIINSLLMIVGGIIANAIEKKKAEKEIIEKEIIYRTVFNYAQDVIVIEESNMQIVDANPAACTFFGYTKEELLKLKTSDLQPVDVPVHPIYSNPDYKSDTNWITLVKNRKNKIMTVEISISKIKSGANVQFISILRDISEQRRTQEEIEKAHLEIQQIFNIASPLCEISIYCEILRVNDSFSKFFNLTQENVIGKKCYDILKGSICRKHDCALLNLSPKKTHFEKEIEIESNNTKIFCKLIATANNDIEGNMISIVENFVDITDQKKAQEEILRLNKNLENRVKEEIYKHEIQQQYIVQKSKLESIGKLAAGMAHEISQPLSGILLALDNIIAKIPDNIQNYNYVQNKFRSILENVERIRQFINHVRIFSRDQKSEISESINVNKVITNALTMVQEQIKAHQNQIILNLSTNPCYVIGNQYKLEQVILNLLTNAKEAIDEKKKHNVSNQFNGKIEISTTSENTFVKIIVSDNGSGISKKNIDMIFEPFFTTKEAEVGTGIGLSITYGIIKEMKGEIKVQSQENEFTTMEIILPLNIE